MRRPVPVLVAGLLLLGAGPAAASSTTAPAQVREHGPDVALRGEIDEPATESVTGVAELRLTGPGADAVPVARSARPTPQDPRRDPRQVAFALTTAPCNLPLDACAAGGVLPNGSWTLQLVEVDRAAGAPDVERGPATTFVVDVPALPPQDVAASLAGRTATVAWSRSVGPGQDLVEPDVSWTVDDGAGRAVTVGPEACSEGRCTADLVYPDDASGPRTLTVSALRPGSSAPTATAAPERIEVPVVPGATPSGSPSGSPSGGPVQGGSGQATAQSFAQGFSSFAPSLGLPKLPPLPEAPAAVAVPQVADTFAPTLGFEDRTETEPVPQQQAAPPAGRDSVLRSTGGLLDDESAVRSLAGAMVLLLAGAHLRAWLAGARPTDL